MTFGTSFRYSSSSSSSTHSSFHLRRVFEEGRKTCHAKVSCLIAPLILSLPPSPRGINVCKTHTRRFPILNRAKRKRKKVAKKY